MLSSSPTHTRASKRRSDPPSTTSPLVQSAPPSPINPLSSASPSHQQSRTSTTSKMPAGATSVHEQPGLEDEDLFNHEDSGRGAGSGASARSSSPASKRPSTPYGKRSISPNMSSKRSSFPNGEGRAGMIKQQPGSSSASSSGTATVSYSTTPPNPSASQQQYNQRTPGATVPANSNSGNGAPYFAQGKSTTPPLPSNYSPPLIPIPLAFPPSHHASSISPQQKTHVTTPIRPPYAHQSYSHPRPIARIPPPTFLTASSPTRTTSHGSTQPSQLAHGRTNEEAWNENGGEVDLESGHGLGLPQDQEEEEEDTYLNRHRIMDSDAEGAEGVSITDAVVAPTPYILPPIPQHEQQQSQAQQQQQQQQPNRPLLQTSQSERPRQLSASGGPGAAANQQAQMSSPDKLGPSPLRRLAVNEPAPRPRPIGPSASSPNRLQQPQQQHSPLSQSSATTQQSHASALRSVMGTGQEDEGTRPKERRLPTPPASRRFGTPPLSQSSSAVRSHFMEGQGSGNGSTYHTPMDSPAGEGLPAGASARAQPSPTRARSPPSHLRYKEQQPYDHPRQQQQQVQEQQPAPRRRNTLVASLNAQPPPPPPRSRSPDRSLPLNEREDDEYQLGGAPHPEVNWYEPHGYDQPLEYVPAGPRTEYQAQPQTHEIHHRGDDGRGSPTPSSALLHQSESEPDLNLMTPRSPSVALPQYDHDPRHYQPSRTVNGNGNGYTNGYGNGQNNYANVAIRRSRGSNSNSLDAIAVQHALMNLQQHPQAHAPTQPHSSYPNSMHNVPDPRYQNLNGHLDYWDGSNRVGSSASNHHPHPQIRPGAPIPPTPRSVITSAPTPSPFDPHGPIPPSPLHFIHPDHPLRQSIAQQWPGGPRMVIPSVPSTAMSSPFPFPRNPFLPPPQPTASIVSSPSHQPVPLPARKRPLMNRRKSNAANGTRPQNHHSYQQQQPVVSTDVMDESAEGGEEDEGETTEGGEFADGMEDYVEQEDVWIEEDEEDMLDNEYHPKYVASEPKRRRRFQQKWEALVKLFHEIDRSTDTTMMLLASPPLTPHYQTHMLLSRSIRRNPNYTTVAHQSRASFSQVSSHRRREKAAEAHARKLEELQKLKLAEQMTQASYIGRQWGEIEALAYGPDGSGPQGEAGLKAALGVALESLKTMHRIYEEREERRRDEAARQSQEAAGIEQLLHQTLLMNVSAARGINTDRERDRDQHAA